MKILLITLIFCVIYLTQAEANSLQRETRIIGGNDARAGEFTFIAAITTRTSDSTFFCGGTLISDQWVLTAGQCVFNGIQFKVQLGSTSLTSEDPDRLTLSTSIYEIHPDYDPITLKNDVGLIKFHMPIYFTTYIEPIRFLASFRLQNSATLQVVGWGQTSDDVGAESEKLRVVNLVALSNDECQKSYDDYVTDEVICLAGTFNEGTCFGDTGGPGVQHVGRGYYIHQGIASFLSVKGCESTEPSGFTRTFSYLDWIRNTSGIIDS